MGSSITVEADLLHLEEVLQRAGLWLQARLTRVTRAGIENSYVAKLGTLILDRSR